MKKRTLAALIWFYVGWVVWNVVAYAAGWTPDLGPAVAAVVAALVAVDPMDWIWGVGRANASAALPDIASKA